MIASWVWHGGGLQAAKAHFGDDRPWIDLSTGINPHPWPTSGIDIDWRRLPEAETIATLEEAAAAHFGVSPHHVCALSGSEIGMRLTGRLIGGAFLSPLPSYRTHGEVTETVERVERGRLDERHGSSLILANPNNPDGHVYSPAELMALLQKRGNDWLLVDEAFADCTPDRSIAQAVADNRNLAVFRSFGKFFGLAGIRLGFLIAPSTLIAKLRAIIGTWPVSAAAAAIGTAAYRDGEWIEATRRTLAQQAHDLDAILLRCGYRAIGASPLFRLIETDNAIGLFEHLARHAILTRPFAENSRWLRVGLPENRAAFARLETALRDV